MMIYVILFVGTGVSMVQLSMNEVGSILFLDLDFKIKMTFEPLLT